LVREQASEQASVSDLGLEPPQEQVQVLERELELALELELEPELEQEGLLEPQVESRLFSILRR